MTSPAQLEIEKAAVKALGRKKALVRFAKFSRDIIADAGRYIFALLPRRSGKTFTVTNKISWCLMRGEGDCFAIGRTQEGAKENLRTVGQHLKAMRLVAAACSEIDAEDTECVIDGFRLQKFFIEMNNGRRCFAMSAHPDALRGFGAAPNGIVSLDEHGFHRDSKELWKGVAPAVMRGGRVIISSTPHYQQGNLFELARKFGIVDGIRPSHQQCGIWSVYCEDIESALEQLAETGLVLDLAELRELAGDDETWLQEFMCRFLSGAEMWFSPELIMAARSPSATAEWDPDAELKWPGEGRLYVGIDIGRYRDYTVIYIIRRALDMNILRGMIVLDRMMIPDQMDVILPILRHPHVARVHIDNTGMGVAIGDGIRKDKASVHKLGAITPKPEDPERREGQVTFTLEHKETMMVLLRNRMESHLEKIPENLPMLERALESIKSTPSALGHRRFDAARTELARHADAAWAMALAVTAADATGIAPAMGGSDPEQDAWRDPEQRRSIWTPEDRSREQGAGSGDEEPELAGTGRALRGGMGVFGR